MPKCQFDRAQLERAQRLQLCNVHKFLRGSELALTFKILNNAQSTIRLIDLKAIDVSDLQVLELWKS
jgi:hypothetical protein